MKKKSNKIVKATKRKKRKYSKKPKVKVNVKNGRPTKFSNQFLVIIKALIHEGKPEKYIAKLLGVSEQTFNNWKIQNPKFFEDVKDWRVEAVKKVERSMFDNANGYEHDALHFTAFEGKVTKTKYTKKYKPSQRAAEFILANKNPDEYKRIIKDEGGAGMKDEFKVVYNLDEL